MPDRCKDCINFSRNLIDGYWCKVTNKNMTSMFNKPEWCPLKEIPTKTFDKHAVLVEYYNGYQNGRNDCIDEILSDET